MCVTTNVAWFLIHNVTLQNDYSHNPHGSISFGVLNMVDIEMDNEQKKPCFGGVSQTADYPCPKGNASECAKDLSSRSF